MSYADNKRWRLGHTTKRNASRKKYYRQFQDAKNSRKRWTLEDMDEIVFSSDVTSDREFHHRLGRSIAAIQHKRCQLWKELRRR